MKIAFYCQNVLGLGHITRSRSILRELCKKHEVTFIQGGQESGLSMDFPKLQIFSLPPIMMRESDGSLYVPNEEAELTQQWEKRAQKIQSLKGEHFDVAIIELFPFGRRQFRKEIDSILRLLKEENPKLKVYCSLRDIMIQKLSEPSRAEQILNALTNFDGVFVHSDPSLIPLELTWPQAKKISKKIHYTGFVSEPSKISNTLSRKRNNDILITAGGGNVGEDFYSAVLKVSEFFPEYQFRFVFGPYAKAEFRQEFETIARDRKNIQTEGLISNFEERLLDCRLSVSLAGYNTVMNILNTQTPALLFPYQANWEQKIRLDIFEKQGKLLVLNSLELDKVKRMMERALNFIPKAFVVNLNGAQKTSELIELLQKKKKFVIF